MKREFELGISRNPLVFGVFSYVDPGILIAPGPPQFVITDDDLYVTTDDGEFVTTG